MAALFDFSHAARPRARRLLEPLDGGVRMGARGRLSRGCAAGVCLRAAQAPAAPCSPWCFRSSLWRSSPAGGRSQAAYGPFWRSCQYLRRYCSSRGAGRLSRGSSRRRRCWGLLVTIPWNMAYFNLTQRRAHPRRVERMDRSQRPPRQPGSSSSTRPYLRVAEYRLPERRTPGVRHRHEYDIVNLGGDFDALPTRPAKWLVIPERYDAILREKLGMGIDEYARKSGFGLVTRLIATSRHLAWRCVPGSRPTWCRTTPCTSSAGTNPRRSPRRRRKSRGFPRIWIRPRSGRGRSRKAKEP